MLFKMRIFAVKLDQKGATKTTKSLKSSSQWLIEEFRRDNLGKKVSGMERGYGAIKAVFSAI